MRSALLFLTIATAACAPDGVEWASASAPTQASGTLTIPLIAQAGPDRFRLVDATFQVQGPTNVTLTAQPDESTIVSPPLTPGRYVVRLLNGWRLQREAEYGFFDVEARLLTGPNQMVTVQNDQITDVTYRFETYGQIVETGEGRVRIGIDVEVVTPETPWRARLLAIGPSHSCAVAEDDTLRCWGDGANGKLGYGNTQSLRIDQAEPVEVGGRVIDLTLDAEHTCAVLEGGAVRCWGLGSSGRLGYGNTENVGDDETPAEAGDVDVGAQALQIDAGREHTCVVVQGARVRCWGFGFLGQLGYGNRENIGDDETPASAGDLELYQVMEVRAGGGHTCARSADGTVRCWGFNENFMAQIGDDEPASAAGANTFDAPATHLEVGSDHYCVALANDAVDCRGLASTRYIPAGYYHLTSGMLGASVQKLAVGYLYSCALLTSGEVRCWGYNRDGVLGSVEPLFPGGVDAADALRVPLTEPAIDVAAAPNGSCAIDAEGTVRCWPRRPLI